MLLLLLSVLGQPADTVAGRVVDPSGQPVVSAIIEVPELGRSVLAGSDGRFAIALAAGRYTLAVRRDGFATSAAELESSLHGASAPVLSEQGRPVAIVSVWGTEHRLPRERLPEIGPRVLDAAEQIKGLLR